MSEWWKKTVKRHNLKRYQFKNKHTGSLFWVDAPSAIIARKALSSPNDWILNGFSRTSVKHDMLITGYQTKPKKR